MTRQDTVLESVFFPTSYRFDDREPIHKQLDDFFEKSSILEFLNASREFLLFRLVLRKLASAYQDGAGASMLPSPRVTMDRRDKALLALADFVYYRGEQIMSATAYSGASMEDGNDTEARFYHNSSLNTPERATRLTVLRTYVSRRTGFEGDKLNALISSIPGARSALEEFLKCS